MFSMAKYFMKKTHVLYKLSLYTYNVFACSEFKTKLFYASFNLKLNKK